VNDSCSVFSTGQASNVIRPLASLQRSVFLVNSRFPQCCANEGSSSLLLPKVRSQFAEFLHERSLNRLGAVTPVHRCWFGTVLLNDVQGSRGVSWRTCTLTHSLHLEGRLRNALVTREASHRAPWSRMSTLRDRLCTSSVKHGCNPWTFGARDFWRREALCDHTASFLPREVATHVSIVTSETSRVPHETPSPERNVLLPEQPHHPITGGWLLSAASVIPLSSVTFSAPSGFDQ
jgi:hypothetical protein